MLTLNAPALNVALFLRIIFLTITQKKFISYYDQVFQFTIKNIKSRI